jgi:hypothetical protein
MCGAVVEQEGDSVHGDLASSLSCGDGACATCMRSEAGQKMSGTDDFGRRLRPAVRAGPGSYRRNCCLAP